MAATPASSCKKSSALSLLLLLGCLVFIAELPQQASAEIRVRNNFIGSYLLPKGDKRVDCTVSTNVYVTKTLVSYSPVQSIEAITKTEPILSTVIAHATKVFSVIAETNVVSTASRVVTSTVTDTISFYSQIGAPAVRQTSIATYTTTTTATRYRESTLVTTLAETFYNTHTHFITLATTDASFSTTVVFKEIIPEKIVTTLGSTQLIRINQDRTAPPVLSTLTSVIPAYTTKIEFVTPAPIIQQTSFVSTTTRVMPVDIPAYTTATETRSVYSTYYSTHTNTLVVTSTSIQESTITSTAVHTISKVVPQIVVVTSDRFTTITETIHSTIEVQSLTTTYAVIEQTVRPQPVTNYITMTAVVREANTRTVFVTPRPVTVPATVSHICETSTLPPEDYTYAGPLPNFV